MFNLSAFSRHVANHKNHMIPGTSMKLLPFIRKTNSGVTKKEKVAFFSSLIDRHTTKDESYFFLKLSPSLSILARSKSFFLIGMKMKIWAFFNVWLFYFVVNYCSFYKKSLIKIFSWYNINCCLNVRCKYIFLIFINFLTPAGKFTKLSLDMT